MKKTSKLLRLIRIISALPIGIALGLIVYISHPQITFESSFVAPIPMVFILALAYSANCVLMSSHQVIPTSEKCSGGLSKNSSSSAE